MLETDYTLRSCQHGFCLLWKHSLLSREWAEDGTSSSQQYSEAEVAMTEYTPDAIKVPCPFSFRSQHCLVTEACLLEPKRDLRNLTFCLFLISLWTTRNYGQEGFCAHLVCKSDGGSKLIMQQRTSFEC